MTNVARGAARSATTLPPLTRGARRLVDGYLLRSLSRRILLSSRALRSFLLTSVSAVAFALSRARAHVAILPLTALYFPCLRPPWTASYLSLSLSLDRSFALCFLFLLLPLLVLPHRLLVTRAENASACNLTAMRASFNETTLRVVVATSPRDAFVYTRAALSDERTRM